MTILNTDINLQRHDEIYQAFVELHDGLSDQESQKTNAKLIFLLANQIGEDDVIFAAIDAIRSNNASTSK